MTRYFWSEAVVASEDLCDSSTVLWCCSQAILPVHDPFVPKLRLPVFDRADISGSICILSNQMFGSFVILEFTFGILTSSKFINYICGC